MALLHLTYYERNLCEHLTAAEKLKITLVLCFANLNMFFHHQEPKYLQSADEKISAFSKQASKVEEEFEEISFIRDVALLAHGVVWFYQRELKKCNNVLNTLLNKMMELVKGHAREYEEEGEIVAITLFYLYKVNHEFGKEDLSEYYLTKSLLYA